MSGEAKEVAEKSDEKGKLPEDPQKALMEMLSSKYPELKPTFDPVLGCRYPEVEEITGNPEKAVQLLEKLAGEGLLVRKLHGKHLSCPFCHSPNVGTLALCPHCKSYNIERKHLIEHFKCGHISVEDNYKVEGKLICPRDKVPLDTAGKDYKIVGSWFLCHDCKKRFHEFYSPTQCRKCGQQFPVRDAELQGCYTYSLGGETEVRRIIGTVLTIRSFLESSGYKVESPGVIRGTSGVDHRFDILASKGEDKKFVIAIEQAEKDKTLGEQPVITLFANVYDIGNTPAYLVAIPGLDKTATQLATMYKLTVIEAKDSEDAAEKLKRILSEGLK